MRCHNCGASHSFSNFLKLIDPVLHEEYRMELFKEKNQGEPPKQFRREAPADVTEHKAQTATAPKKKTPTIFKQMQSVLRLPEDHIAVKYLESRKIPKDKWKYFFFIEKYYQWINKVKSLPNKKVVEKYEHSRLIIPYFDKDYNIFRITARALDDAQLTKYLFTVLDDEKPSLYNYDFIDPDQRVYIVEGQIDSLFLPNAIAVGNANYGSPELKKLRDKVIVPDNQPRNKDVVNQLEKVIEMGYPICIWDRDYGEKDINSLIQNGMSQEEIKNIIDRNTYQGAVARLKFVEWKRC
jgi:DNA primase